MENPQKGEVVLRGNRRARVVSLEGTAMTERGPETLYELEFIDYKSGNVGCLRETFTFPAPEAKEKMGPAAYHEAGHMTIAAVRGLKLRPEGFMVDLGGMGLARFATQPEENDASRKGVILATFAGFWAELRFCEMHSVPGPEPLGITLSDDWIAARTVISKLSFEEYRPGDNPATILPKLENRSRLLVEQYWAAIETLSTALLAKELQPTKLLDDGTPWSWEATARFVNGKETVELLAQHEIIATSEAPAA